MVDERDPAFQDRLRRRIRNTEFMRGHDLKFAKEFREKFPPGTSVYGGKDHLISGTTVENKGIYADPHDLYVFANQLEVDGVKLPSPNDEYKFSALTVEPRVQ